MQRDCFQVFELELELLDFGLLMGNELVGFVEFMFTSYSVSNCSA